MVSHHCQKTILKYALAVTIVLSLVLNQLKLSTTVSSYEKSATQLEDDLSNHTSFTIESIEKSAVALSTNNSNNSSVPHHHVNPTTSLNGSVENHKDSSYGVLSSTAQGQEQELSNIVLRFRQGLLTHLPPKSIPVVLWPFMDPAMKGDKGISADVIHIELNGVEESHFLRLANESVRTMDPNVVWVTDAKFPYKLWCIRLSQKAQLAQERRRNSTDLMLPLSWPIFVVDFTDTTHYESCPELEAVVGKENVFYSKRSIVVNRTWVFEKDWIQLGERLPATTSEGRFYQQTPLIVRTDIVEELANQLQTEHHLTLSSDVMETMNNSRTVHVAHYWPASTERAQFSNMRNRVSTLLMQHFSKKYNIWCDMVGTADRVGRRHAQSDYVRAMLQTKIIVVAQRDTYEDHYRLYEALVSGALVITDPMWTLPSDLKNGSSIIVFTSLDEFVHQVKYYLEHDDERIAIAKAGRFAALNRHRSWHRMESIILGHPVTTCEQNPTLVECPYMIHTNNNISNDFPGNL